MNRSEFFKGLLGIWGMGQITSHRPICQALDGRETYCELKEDEERCPLGHAQKPKFHSLLILRIGEHGNKGLHLDDVELERQAASACAVCGIVYVLTTIPAKQD